MPCGNRFHDDWDDDETAEGLGYPRASTADEDVEPDDDRSDEVIFQVSNPQGSVAVSAYINGRVANVDLSPAVSRMTERELAEEIRVLGDLARDQARAGQHTLVQSVMTALGHDPVYTTGFLRRQIGLPTPEDADDERVRVFAARYFETGEDWD